MSLVVIGTSLCDDMFTGREAAHPFMTEVGPWQIVFAARALTRTHKPITIMSSTNKLLEKFAWPPNSRAHQRTRAVEIKTWHHQEYVCVRAVWSKKKSPGTNTVHGIVRTHLALDEHS